MSRHPAELARLLRAGDTPGVVAFFAGASEAERQPFAAATAEWHALIELNQRALYSFRPADQLRPEQRLADVPTLRPASDAAMLACASLAQLKALSFVWSPSDDVFVAILRDRRPPWIEEFVGALAASRLSRSYGLIWRKVRALVRAGICPPPSHDHYVLGALEGIQPVVDLAENQQRLAQGLPPKPPPAMLDLLLAERDWLETAFWRLFELEGTAEVSPANADKYGGGWTEPVVQLAARGVLARERLLDATLAALARDFVAFRAGWFSRLHEALQPNAAERRARADAYVGLLASSAPRTVSFALEALLQADATQPLPAATLLPALRPVLTARGKGLIKSALQLLERVAMREPAARADVCIAGAEALLLDATDVQKAVFALLERHGCKTDPTLRARLAEFSTAVAASLRPKLKPWLESDGSAPAAPVPRAAATPAASPISTPLPSRLDPARALAPITSLDDLIDLAARVLEAPEDPNDIERVLDGVSRFCAERPDDFARRTGPLRKRAERLYRRAPAGHMRSPLVFQSLACVLLAWCEGEQTLRELEFNAKTLAGPVAFLVQRIEALAQRVALPRALPLLSAPTHRDGWIAPAALVQRWTAWQAAKLEPPIQEQVLALLRLAPETRNAALAAASAVHGEAGAALRLALGGEERTGRNAPLWLAAWRSRQPSGDLEDFERVHPKLGPDAGTGARFTWTADTTRRSHEEQSWTRFALSVQRTPAVPRKIDPALLPVIFHGEQRLVAMNSRELWQWLTCLWPANYEGFFAHILPRLETALDWSDVADRETAGCFGVLSRPHAGMRPMSCLVLALGLAAQDAALRSHATEDLIAVIGDGRLDAPELGETMSRLLDSGSGKFARWAKSLAVVARVSPLHASAAADLIQRALHGEPEKARDLGALLELLVELLSETNAPLADPRAREYLSRLGTGGKTGQLARQLLRL